MNTNAFTAQQFTNESDAFWAVIDELDAQREADLAAEARYESIKEADLEALIAELDAEDEEPYADEYQAPAAQSAWTAVDGPADLWESRPLTEWEVSGF